MNQTILTSCHSRSAHRVLHALKATRLCRPSISAHKIKTAKVRRLLTS